MARRPRSSAPQPSTGRRRASRRGALPALAAPSARVHPFDPVLDQNPEASIYDLPPMPTGPEPWSSTSTDQTAPRTDNLAGVVARRHQRYIGWNPIWRELGHLYEGDGPYSDGNALIPHLRELNYASSVGTDGVVSVDYSTVIGEKLKFTRRKQLARYENFAAAIVDTLVDHQYAKGIVRTVDPIAGQALLDRVPLERWWEDVTGDGMHIDDWFKWVQTLANVYGHVFIVMDRLNLNPTRRTYSTSPAGQKTAITSLADQGQPILRWYLPTDAPDWLAPFRHLTAVKFIEPIERVTLMQPDFPYEERYLIWDRLGWQRFSQDGQLVAAAPHFMDGLPVTMLYARRRARIPILGRSDLGHPSLFRDHYNLTSELRELLRANTFSMLNVRLAEGQTIEQARGLLGDHAGADSILYSRGDVVYIQPASGPVQAYASALSDLERKIFRLSGIPWEMDSRDYESADALRIRTSDLDRKLASHADHAEELDYWIARMWCTAVYGARGAAAFAAMNPTIQHPDEFNVEEIIKACQEARATIDIGVGSTATTLLRQRVARIALPDVSHAELRTIDSEIEKLPAPAAGAMNTEPKDTQADPSGTRGPVVPPGGGEETTGAEEAA